MTWIQHDQKLFSLRCICDVAVGELMRYASCHLFCNAQQSFILFSNTFVFSISLFADFGLVPALIQKRQQKWVDAVFVSDKRGNSVDIVALLRYERTLTFH